MVEPHCDDAKQKTFSYVNEKAKKPRRFSRPTIYMAMGQTNPNPYKLMESQSLLVVPILHCPFWAPCFSPFRKMVLELVGFVGSKLRAPEGESIFLISFQRITFVHTLLVKSGASTGEAENPTLITASYFSRRSLVLLYPTVEYPQACNTPTSIAAQHLSHLQLELLSCLTTNRKQLLSCDVAPLQGPGLQQLPNRKSIPKTSAPTKTFKITC